MENGPKNYIPEDVLSEAGGDPRVTFGTMALQELAVIEGNSAQQGVIEMTADQPLEIQTSRDVWSRMDDI